MSLNPGAAPNTVTAVALTDVTVRAWDPRAAAWHELLHDVTWTVHPGEQWAVLGPNGAGKTTVLATVAGTRSPVAGTVAVLGRRVGSPRMRDPRQHIGLIESTPRSFAQRLSPIDVVLKGVGGSVAQQGHRSTAHERERAIELLRRVGCGELLDRRYQDCSQGERQRVLIARALMRRPHLLLLDEPTTGLDLPAREGLLHAMGALATEVPDLATVTVTHHVEELAASTTHALLLRDGRVTASGPVDETLTDEHLSASFGVAVTLSRVGGRWAAHSGRGSGW